MRVWGTWSVSAKPASDPRPEPVLLSPSLTCLPHYTPGAPSLTSWLQVRGLGKQAGALKRPGQGSLQAGAGPVFRRGHKVETRVPLFLWSQPPTELITSDS